MLRLIWSSRIRSQRLRRDCDVMGANFPLPAETTEAPRRPPTKHTVRETTAAVNKPHSGFGPHGGPPERGHAHGSWWRGSQRVHGNFVLDCRSQAHASPSARSACLSGNHTGRPEVIHWRRRKQTMSERRPRTCAFVSSRQTKKKGRSCLSLRGRANFLEPRPKTSPDEPGRAYNRRRVLDVEHAAVQTQTTWEGAATSALGPSTDTTCRTRVLAASRPYPNVHTVSA